MLFVNIRPVRPRQLQPDYALKILVTTSVSKSLEIKLFVKRKTIVSFILTKDKKKVLLIHILVLCQFFFVFFKSYFFYFYYLLVFFSIILLINKKKCVVCTLYINFCKKTKSKMDIELSFSNLKRYQYYHFRYLREPFFH